MCATVTNYGHKIRLPYGVLVVFSREFDRERSCLGLTLEEPSLRGDCLFAICPIPRRVAYRAIFTRNTVSTESEQRYSFNP